MAFSSESLYFTIRTTQCSYLARQFRRWYTDVSFRTTNGYIVKCTISQDQMTESILSFHVFRLKNIPPDTVPEDPKAVSQDLGSFNGYFESSNLKLFPWNGIFMRQLFCNTFYSMPEGCAIFYNNFTLFKEGRYNFSILSKNNISMMHKSLLICKNMLRKEIVQICGNSSTYTR